MLIINFFKNNINIILKNYFFVKKFSLYKMEEIIKNDYFVIKLGFTKLMLLLNKVNISKY